MTRNTKSDKDFMRAMVEAWKCGETLWEELYYKVQDVEALMSISTTLCELFNEKLYKDAMDLIYVLCMALDIDNILFAELYSNEDMMLHFINEVVMESEDVDLQYHHNLYPAAGLWGWLDLDGNEIISPQYIFAIGFYEGKAMVAKGEWSLNEEGEYWCNEEKWGVIDTSNREIIPCIYDEIYAIEDSDRYFLCHKGGWETGCQIVYDTINKCEITELDSYFDSGYILIFCYMLNRNRYMQSKNTSVR